jgi:hypothetical protein
MTTIRRTLSSTALGGLLFAGGCAQLLAANATPPAPMEGQLTATLQQAEREVIQMRFGVADRLLADFAESHANTPEAMETGFWRALFKLDPLNQSAGPREAGALLDTYLGGSVIVAHRGAAITLRRVASALDRPGTAVAASTGNTPGAPGVPAAKPDEKARDDELQRLKDELAKANAELERIKRRLAQPNP